MVPTTATSQVTEAAALSLQCASQIRTSLTSLKRDVALSFRICSRDFGVLGRELLSALAAKQERERAAALALDHERHARRKAQHKALEMQGAIRVLCKVRPLLPHEVLATPDDDPHAPTTADTIGVTVPSPHDIHVVVPATSTSSLDSALASSLLSASSSSSALPTTATKSFSFERVFTDESTLAQLYKDVQPLVMAAVDGQHACVFAYGQTGAGKTHSIYGASGESECGDSGHGLAGRAAETIFEMVREQRALFDFNVTLQMVEIYNEDMFDLLGEEDDGGANSSSGSNTSGEGPSMLVVPFHTTTSSHSHSMGSSSNNSSNSSYAPAFVSRRPVGEIRHGERGVYLRNVESVAVHSAEDVLQAMQRGELNRTIHTSSHNHIHSHNHSHNSNSASRREDADDHRSRSHCVAMLDIQRCSHVDGQIDGGRFVIVDLAGSERIIRTETSGLRLREAQHINKSLAAIGDVLAALLAKDKHVPFRNSKLTHLLQDSLGATDAQTLVLVHVSPSSQDVAETVSTLKFASRVNQPMQRTYSRRSERHEIHRLHGTIASQATQLQALQDKLAAELELRRKYEKRLEEYRQDECRRRAKDEERSRVSTPSKQQQPPSTQQPESTTSSAIPSTPSKVYGPMLPPSHQKSTVSSSRLLAATPEQPFATRRWSLYTRKDTFKSSNSSTNANTSGHAPRVVQVAKPSTAGGQENISENIPRLSTTSSHAAHHRSSPAVHKSLPSVPEKPSRSTSMATPVRRARRLSLMHHSDRKSAKNAMRSPLRVAASATQRQQHTGAKRKAATPMEVRRYDTDTGGDGNGDGDGVDSLTILKKQRLSLDPQQHQQHPQSHFHGPMAANGDVASGNKQVSFDLSSGVVSAAMRVGGVHLLPPSHASSSSSSSMLPPRLPPSVLRTPMSASRVPAPAARVRTSIPASPAGSASSSSFLASPMARVRTGHQSPSKPTWNRGWR